ncbi:hypothetical protein P691DRAFT_769863 [Macrolepiota fuliginosa MF-IS2]|uniref:Uncharacterized protein n=1 Tax=Macrolepiota fuliginosa MF-IS2 TaxID=1400762 RepID=A0A9P5WX60_9AGAR|nr:hypothetical protein P691DRAFT_769863 [Macrolepiota fuliginosa MF-IS2]
MQSSSLSSIEVFTSTSSTSNKLAMWLDLILASMPSPFPIIANLTAGNEDIHMEPPTPTHVFSEAAM